MRDSLKPGDNEQKEYNVLVGGTGVATATSATFTLGTASTTPTGFTATFMDGETAVGDAITGTEITLPAVPAATATRYYVGWTVDGGETVLKAGSSYTLAENKTFTAVYYAKGDVNQDGSVDYNDAGDIYLYEAKLYSDIGTTFWSNDGKLQIDVADVNADDGVDYNDAGDIYLYEAKLFGDIANKFWE